MLVNENKFQILTPSNSIGTKTPVNLTPIKAVNNIKETIETKNNSISKIK